MSQDLEQEPATGLFPGPISLFWGFVAAMSIIPLGAFLFSQMGRHFFFAELFNNFRLQMSLMLLPFAILSFGFRRTLFPVILIGTTLWCAGPVLLSYLPDSKPPAGKTSYRVMSYNVLGVNRQHVEVIQQIRDVDPDVLLVVEYSRNWLDAMELLGKQFPYQIQQARWHGFGIALFSKYPFEKEQVKQITDDVTDNPMVVATVNFGDQKIRFAGLHVLSPTNRFRLDIRNRQFDEAANFLAESDEPTVVMGDFNCVPWSAFLKDFSRKTKYRDSRRGFGYQATWPDISLVKIPIDHAFVSKHMHVHERRVGERCGSDHAPIILEVSTQSE